MACDSQRAFGSGHIGRTGPIGFLSSIAFSQVRFFATRNRSAGGFGWNIGQLSEATILDAAPLREILRPRNLVFAGRLEVDPLSLAHSARSIRTDGLGTNDRCRVQYEDR